MPALLSAVSLGSAAAARVAVTTVQWPLLLFSVALLAYSHYRVWFRHHGHPAVRIVLLINTLLVAFLWAWRLPF